MNDAPNVKDIFISYNKADEAWAKTLAERIERETTDGNPNGQKLTSFFAPWDIEVGKNFINTLNGGLAQGRFFAPVMSPEFFASGWTNFEWTNQVALDPTNAQGKIIPLFLRDLTLNEKERIVFPAPFNVLNRVDFRPGRDFEAGFAEVIRILQGRPKSRGSSGPATILRQSGDGAANAMEKSSPADVSELLVSNLLPITKMPDKIWSANTAARKSPDVYAVCKTQEAFILTKERIYSFANVADPVCPLSVVLSKPEETKFENVSSWMQDRDQQKDLVRLLNQCLRQHCYERRIRKDEKGRYFFSPDYKQDNSETKTLISRHHHFAEESKGRFVASQKTNPVDGTPFWVHYAARMRIEILGDRLFLRIDPTFIFTKDGKEPLDGKAVGKLSIQWTGKQQNPDVLRAVLFWSRILSDGKKEVRVPAGGEFIIASAVPGFAKTNFGVGGDYVRIGDLIDEPGDLLEQVAAEASVIESDEAPEEPKDEDDAP